MQRNKGKTPGKTSGRLDLLGLYVHGAVKTAKAPRGRAGYLHPHGDSLGRPSTSCPHGSWHDRGSAQASSGGLVVRAQPTTPQRNEQAFALLELMLFSSPPVPQRRSDCPESQSPRTVMPLAGDSSPASLQRPTVRHDTVRQAVRLGSAALRSLQLLTDCRLQADQAPSAAPHNCPQLSHNSDHTPEPAPPPYISSSARSRLPPLLPARAGNFQKKGVFSPGSGPFSFFWRVVLLLRWPA